MYEILAPKLWIIVLDIGILIFAIGRIPAVKKPRTIPLGFSDQSSRHLSPSLLSISPRHPSRLVIRLPASIQRDVAGWGRATPARYASRSSLPTPSAPRSERTVSHDGTDRSRYRGSTATDVSHIAIETAGIRSGSRRSRLRRRGRLSRVRPAGRPRPRSASGRSRSGRGAPRRRARGRGPSTR